jgi:copper chaperone CopZ
MMTDVVTASHGAARQRAAPDAPSTVAKVTIPVGGMTCAACQASVQRALSRQPGVREVSVNLMLKNAAVVFDSAHIARPRKSFDRFAERRRSVFWPVRRRCFCRCR